MEEQGEQGEQGARSTERPAGSKEPRARRQINWDLTYLAALWSEDGISIGSLLPLTAPALHTPS
jgi:hypothetical protein